jgi:hypothetical protein
MYAAAAASTLGNLVKKEVYGGDLPTPGNGAFPILVETRQVDLIAASTPTRSQCTAITTSASAAAIVGSTLSPLLRGVTEMTSPHLGCRVRWLLRILLRMCEPCSEGFDASADIAHKIGNLALSAEQQENDRGHDQDVPDAERTHEISRLIDGPTVNIATNGLEISPDVRTRNQFVGISIFCSALCKSAMQFAKAPKAGSKPVRVHACCSLSDMLPSDVGWALGPSG